MKTPTLSQIIIPAEDGEPERVHYAADKGLGKSISSIRLDNYPTKASITIMVTGEGKEMAVLEQLRKAGFDVKKQSATREHESTLMIPETAKQDGLIPLALELGRVTEANTNLIDRQVAMHLIDDELARLGKTPSQAGMVTFSNVLNSPQPGRRPETRHSFIVANISHPFSTVEYMAENGSVAGGKTTRIGTSSAAKALAVAECLEQAGISLSRTEDTATVAANAEVTQALKRAGINPKKTLSTTGEHDVFAQVPAPEVAKILSEKGLIPPSIAAEVAGQQEVVSMNFTERAAQRPTQGTGRIV